MEQNKEPEKKETIEKICEQVDKKLEALSKEGIQQSNIDYVGKLIDVKKDIKEMEEKDMYRDYGNYNGYNEGYGRGRYNEGYGRRGVPGSGRGRYRGEDMLDEMKYHYGAYQDSYNTGNYNAKEDSSYKMTEAFKEFVYAVGEELDPKDKQIFKQAMQEMVQKLN